MYSALRIVCVSKHFEEIGLHKHCCLSPPSLFVLKKKERNIFHFACEKHQKNPETNKLNKQKVGCNWIEGDECIPSVLHIGYTAAR